MATHVEAQLGATPWRTAITVNGHDLVADEPAEHGGGDSGPTPFGLVLSGLSACTSITLGMYAQRKGWPLTGLQTTLDLDVTAQPPRITRSVVVAGDLSPEAVARLRDVVERTPVTLALKSGFSIDTTLDGPASVGAAATS